MKTNPTFAIVALFAMAVIALGQTNFPSSLIEPPLSDTSTNAIPVIGPLAPLLKLLPSGTSDFVMTIIVWMGGFTLVLAPFSVWIQHKLADMMNTAASSADLDDDAWLRRMFSNPVYRFAATLLRFAHVRLPVQADLDRALEIEALARAEVKPADPIA